MFWNDGSMQVIIESCAHATIRMCIIVASLLPILTVYLLSTSTRVDRFHEHVCHIAIKVLPSLLCFYYVAIYKCSLHDGMYVASVCAPSSAPSYEQRTEGEVPRPPLYVFATRILSTSTSNNIYGHRALALLYINPHMTPLSPLRFCT